MCGIRYGTVACYCYSFRFRPFVFFFPPSSYSIICTYYYWNLYYYPPPLFIVFDLYHKTNNRDHPTRIDSSLYRIDPSLFIVSYGIFLPLFTCRSDLVRVLLLPLLSPPMTTPTPTPLSFVIVESILNLIRTHLSRRLTFL